MSVSVSFYYNPNETNVIEKQIGSALYTTSAELYDNTDILSPELKVAWNDSYVNTYNYLYVAEFKRYYFIDKVIAEPGGAARIKCSVDVLYTYKSSLMNTWVYVTRCASPKIGFLPYLPTDIKDTQFPVYANKDVRTFKFAYNNAPAGYRGPFTLSNPVSGGKYFVLNLMGKKGSGE